MMLFGNCSSSFALHTKCSLAYNQSLIQHDSLVLCKETRKCCPFGYIFIIFKLVCLNMSKSEVRIFKVQTKMMRKTTLFHNMILRSWLKHRLYTKMDTATRWSLQFALWSFCICVLLVCEARLRWSLEELLFHFSATECSTPHSPDNLRRLRLSRQLS